MIKNYHFIGLFINFYTIAQNVETLKVPENFEISILAKNLDSPRQMTETLSGHIIVGSKKAVKLLHYQIKIMMEFLNSDLLRTIYKILLELFILRMTCILLKWIQFG